jgi:hypothetical protein
MPGYLEKVEVSAAVVQRGSVGIQAAEPLQVCEALKIKAVKTVAEAEETHTTTAQAKSSCHA